jgi:ferredoxin--NADP+ reductase
VRGQISKGLAHRQAAGTHDRRKTRDFDRAVWLLNSGRKDKGVAVVTASVAIVGAGPSGFYAAEALLKSGPDCRIDIIEKLPTPYGLVRAGVAPDHQSTKRVIKAYERTAAHERVRFYGNVALDRDLSLAELRDLYDAVILATGAPRDRKLGIPGEDKTGVLGSAAFVGWYNGHPEFQHLDPPLDTETVAVIGNGNVAIDIARVLIKTRQEMRASDIADYAAEAIFAAPIRKVHMIGRRGPVEARFTTKELRELGELSDARPIVDPRALPESVPESLGDRDRRLAEKNLDVLRRFAEIPDTGQRKQVQFDFYAKPVEVLGEERVTGLRLERTRLVRGRAEGTGEIFEIPCGLVVSAIGYEAMPISGVPFDKKRGRVRNREGRVAPGLYVVGWVKRGPRGVIGTNKADGDQAARAIARDFAGDGSKKPGRAGLEAMLSQRHVDWVSFRDWRVLDEAEVAAAPPGSPRRKLTKVKEMLDLLRQERAGSDG